MSSPFARTAFAVSVSLFISNFALAEAYNVGPKTCADCHQLEIPVWEGTKHYSGYKKAHKRPESKKILAALGEKSMKRSPSCSLCHYTLVQKEAGGKASAKAGVSCESCHGAASEWLDIHNTFGEGKKVDTETAAHKKQRFADAQAAGMIMSHMHYDIAKNCANCHGLSNDKLKTEDLAVMLDSGHPLNLDFEFVKYSQGTVRHRFYPPDINSNKEMTAEELARFFVIGQAAKLVSAAQAADNSDHPKYKEAQQQRVADAKKALSAVKSVPSAAALVAEPSEANARKLVADIQGKNLTGDVGSLLPAKSSYK